MTTTVRTPLAEWRQNDDGSWEPIPTLGQAREAVTSGGPGPGGSFGPEDILAGDQVLVTELPDGKVLIERGGHAILYAGTERPWRPNLDFRGGGITVTDDFGSLSTIVEFDQGAASGAMVWRGAYDAGAIYAPGDVVVYGDAIFVWSGTAEGYGFGFGPFGEGPFGGTEPAGGWGSEPFGEGPFGG